MRARHRSRAARPELPRAAGSRVSFTRATTATARWWPRSMSIRTPGRSPSRDACARVDCGPISNPDGLRNQIEGGIVQGISRTLREEVTWDAERVTSVDWRTYRPWYLGDPVPVIECVLLNRADVGADGAGETSVTITAAAIGNAVFDATGVRLREVPFTPERVKRALETTFVEPGESLGATVCGSRTGRPAWRCCNALVPGRAPGGAAGAEPLS